MRNLFYIGTFLLSLALFQSGAQAAEESRPESAEGYVAISPLNISIVKDFQVQGMLQVEIGLDIPDKKLREQALKIYHRLEDTYRYSFSAWEFLNLEGLIILGALLIGLIAALLPAVQASKTDIAETLSEG